MTGPIHWESYGGDFLERLLAALMSQKHPDTIRRTPASGDGGVDLLVPVDGGYEVTQVKGFAGRLNSSRKVRLTPGGGHGVSIDHAASVAVS